MPEYRMGSDIRSINKELENESLPIGVTELLLELKEEKKIKLKNLVSQRMDQRNIR